MRVLLCVALFLSVAAPALAQAEATVPTQLHLFRDEGAGEYVMSFDKDAPYSQGTWGGQLPYAGGVAGRTFSFRLVDAAPAAVLVDGDIEITAVWGSEAAGAGPIDWSLKSGSETIGSGSWDTRWAAGYQTHTATVPFSGALDLAEPLVFAVVSDTGYASVAARMDLAASGIVLPVVPQAPTATIIVESLEDAAVEHGFDNATSDAYQYNFTQVLTTGRAVLDANVTSGNATVVLHDDVGAEIVNLTILESGIQSVEFTNATAGTWELLITYAAFNGSLSFVIEEAASAAPDETPVGSTEDAGNATTNETLDDVVDGQEAPAFALPLLIAGLVALARRRR